MNSYKIDKKVWAYVLLAFTFSMLVRLIWVYEFSGYEDFYWNNQFMINTNDGYFFAEGARDILSGISQENDLSPTHLAASQLTAFFAKILPFSFESIIFYMPAFLSSLIVIPMMFIAKSLERVELGFVAALVASVTWSYYNRTMIGYYDTDMLNIVFPTFVLSFLIVALKSKEQIYLLLSGLTLVAYSWWYSASYSLGIAFFVFVLFYTLAFHRKEIFNYKLLIIMLFAMIGLPIFVKLLAVVAVYLSFRIKKLDSYIYYFLAFALLVFLVTGGLSPVLAKLKGYVFQDDVKVVGEGLKLHYFSVMQTVREAGHIPFEVFANRISGSILAFLLALVGYVIMVLRYRVMLLGLPLLGLGFLAYVGGLRFTIYAVPVMAFGIAYTIFYANDLVKKALSSQSQKLSLFFVSACTVLVLYPNITHIIGYRVPTVFTKPEVKVLDELKTKASREDYVLAWWDYGYPIRYYSDVKTLVDGGKHSGGVNFAVSYALTYPQNVSAKLARLDVEYTEKAFRVVKENEGKDKKDRVKLQTNMAQMSLDYGFNDADDFLYSLSSDIKLPKKSRDIYFYLPFRMINILPTVARFSDIDLMNGKTIRKPFFYMTQRFQEDGDILNLANGILFNKKTGMVKLGEREVALREFYITTYDKQGKLVKKGNLVNFNASLCLIFMRNYNTFLLMDTDMLNSTYIQLFVLENYDKEFFEPVILTPNSKVYKLKI